VSVPYRGSSPALIDLMSGQVQCDDHHHGQRRHHVKAGKLRALAATGSQAQRRLPRRAHVHELGINGMDYEQWFGMMGPANMPKSVVDKLAAAMDQVLRMPDVRERLVAGMALEVAQPGPGLTRA
jgi:tripartite-type tricarboxylate transporter receptor subunit TctC